MRFDFVVVVVVVVVQFDCESDDNLTIETSEFFSAFLRLFFSSQIFHPLCISIRERYWIHFFEHFKILYSQTYLQQSNNKRFGLCAIVLACALQRKAYALILFINVRQYISANLVFFFKIKSCLIKENTSLKHFYICLLKKSLFIIIIILINQL